MAFVLDQKKQKGERMPDWYVEGSPCGEDALNTALSWYSRAKSLRTAGFESGIIIDELRLREFGELVLGLNEENLEMFALVVMHFIYVENAFAKDPQWEYGEEVRETEDADTRPIDECGD